MKKFNCYITGHWLEHVQKPGLVWRCLVFLFLDNISLSFPTTNINFCV